MRTLKALYIDCGSTDQFNLVYGARRCTGAWTSAASSTDYEEFDDNHSGVDYRMDISLPFLAGALSN